MRKGGSKPTPANELSSSVKPMKVMASTTEMRTTDQKSKQGSAQGMARSNRSVEPLM